jgi:hypothetical protein
VQQRQRQSLRSGRLTSTHCTTRCSVCGRRAQQAQPSKPAASQAARRETGQGTPAEERRAVAYAIGWIERRVGKAIGTETDRAGMDFSASGDPTQQDCVDEATNTTSYLTVLASAGLIRHHTVDTPFAKDNLLKGIEGWTHWTAVLKETAAGQRWAVDSWIYANGENPAIVEVENWYIKDLASLPKPLR